MKTKAIIERDDSVVLSVDEMCHVVQEYIKTRKNREIVVNIFKNIPENHPLMSIILQQEISKLHEAYNEAKAWLLINKYNK